MQDRVGAKEQVSFVLNGKPVVPGQTNQPKPEEEQQLKPDEQPVKSE